MDENNKPMTEKSQTPVNGGKPAARRRRGSAVGLNVFLIVLIVILAISGLYLIFEPYYVHWQQDRLSRSLLDNFENGDGTIVVDPDAYAVPGEDDDYNIETITSATTADTSVTTGETAGPTTAETTAAKPDEVVITAIARIEIPVIDVNLPVAEDATVYNLRYAIGHYIYSAPVGQRGLSILLGHRSYSYGRNFNRMGEVEIGDEIIIETKSYRYFYEVDKIDVVLPDQLLYEFNATVEGSRIMLVTCTPIRVASHRMLVKGELTKTEKILPGG